jgi:tripartite-type tricarboxylate transporter receptor subunit TctC
MTHVPYKGGGPLMQDAVAGHVPLSIGSVFVTKPHIDSKRMRPLAVTTSKRSSELPDVPTVAESGNPGFDAPAWWALLAPARIFIDRQIDIWEKVVKENNIKAE